MLWKYIKRWLKWDFKQKKKLQQKWSYTQTMNVSNTQVFAELQSMTSLKPKLRSLNRNLSAAARPKEEALKVFQIKARGHIIREMEQRSGNFLLQSASRIRMNLPGTRHWVWISQHCHSGTGSPALFVIPIRENSAITKSLKHIRCYNTG